MPITRISITNAMTFDQVTTRLSQQRAVDGLIVVGSASADQMTPASDYDLVLVLSEMPVPLHTGVTHIDGRFTDLVFHTSMQIEQILDATKPFGFWDWTGRLVGWLMNGRVVFDRHGMLQLAQTKVQSANWIVPIGDHEAYAAWQSINYNLAVVRRYLTSDAPDYLAAADLRMMLYGPQDLFWNYFQVRKLAPDSEKQQIIYLEEHDPQFLAQFKYFLTEQDRHEKFRRYEALATTVLAPVGQLWQVGEVVLNLDAEAVTPKLELNALDFWESLVLS